MSSEALFSLLIMPQVWCQPLAVLLGAAAGGWEATRDGEIGKLRLYICGGGFRGAESTVRVTAQTDVRTRPADP